MAHASARRLHSASLSILSAAAFLAAAACGDHGAEGPTSGNRAAVTGPSVAVGPARVTFPDANAERTEYVTIADRGDAPLTISAVETCAETAAAFTVASVAPVTLRPGETVQQAITYRPAGADPGIPESGCLTVVSDDPASPRAVVTFTAWRSTVTACTACHGDPARTPAAIASAPPVGLAGSRDTTAPGVGAHQAHLVAGRVASPIACSECHPPFGLLHQNGKTDVAWGPLATGNGKVVPAYDGATCTNACHGASLSGGTITRPSWTKVDGTQAACGTCHGVPPPGAGHPTSMDCASCHCGYTATSVNLATHMTGVVELDGACSPGCATCHGTPPNDHVVAYPGSGGTGDFAECAGCHAGYTATAVNPSTHQDGIYEYSLGGSSCGVCHGAPPPFSSAAHPQDPLAGPSAAACGSCHAGYGSSSVSPSLHRNGSIDATVTCSSCHGNPPLVTSTGASHPTSTSCGDCHCGYTAGTVNAATHRTGIVEVGGGCTVECFGCHGLPPPQTHALAYPGSGGSASFTDCGACHTGFTPASAGATHENGTVDYALGPTSCGVCHASPPPVTSAGAPHTTSTACGSCHCGFTSTTVTPAFHMNGHLDGGSGCGAQDCTACHGDPSRPTLSIQAAPPADTSGNVATTARGVGAHQAHLVAGTLRVAMVCTDCHAVPAGTHPSGSVELTWSLLARTRGVTPTWNGATCNDYCHGTSLGSGNGSNHDPTWTAVNGTQDACGTCHGAPTTGRPSTGRHTSVSSHASRACTDCHVGTASATSATHVNGVVDLQASLNWNASIRSCSPSCHGTTSWGGTAYSVPPTVAAEPQAIQFSNVPVGSTATQTVRIRNLGTSSLTVTGLSLCTGTSTEFSLSSTAGFVLAAGASQVVAVTYRPTSTALDTGCFDIRSSDAAHDRTAVTLSATHRYVPPFASISAMPNPLAFGTVAVGTPKTVALTIGNSGTTVLSVTNVSPCAGTTPGFTVSPTALTVAAGGTGTVNVTWTPYVAGPVSSASCLAFTSNAMTNPYIVPLSGSAGEPLAFPILSADPSPLDFGTVAAGAATTRTITLRNTGNAPLSASPVGVCAGTTPGFAFSPAALTIPVGATAKLDVTWTPAAAGPVAAGSCILIPTPASGSGGGGSVAPPSASFIPLAGTALTAGPPSLSVAPSALDFGGVPGFAAATQGVRIQNLGTSPLAVTGLALCQGTGPEFSLSSTAGFTLPAGASQTIAVTFKPTATTPSPDAGCFDVFSTDESGAPTARTVTLKGSVLIGAPLSATPTPLEFGTVTVGAPVTRALTLLNTVPAPLDITSIGFCAGTTPGFTVSPTALTLAALGGTATVDVTWDPAVAGPVAPESCVAFTTPAGLHTVPLAGTAVAPPPPVLSVSPSPLAFGEVTTGSARQLTVTISNAGAAALNVSGVSRCTGTSSEFSVSSTTAFSVPAGGSATRTITYRPSAAGTDIGCFAFVTNDAASPTYNLSVSGTGVSPRPAVSASPTSLAFGTVHVGSSRSLALTVSNTGTATLNVSGVSRCSGTSDEFRLSSTGGFSLSPGGSRQLWVTYRPGGSGTDSGCVAISSDDPARGRLEVPVSGTGAR